MAISGGNLHVGLSPEQLAATEVIVPPAQDCDEHALSHAPDENLQPTPWTYRWGQVFRFLSLPFDIIFLLLMRRTIVLGGEHLRDFPGPVIFAGTHRSVADTPLLRYALRRYGATGLLRRMVVAAAAEGWKKARLMHQFGALAFGLYPVHGVDRRGLRLEGLSQLLAEQHSLLIYPQGGYASSNEECTSSPKARFRLGVAYLTVKSNVAVMPFGLAGTEDMISPALAGKFRGRSFIGAARKITPASMVIAFGPPLRPEPDETLRAFTTRLQEVCHQLTADAEQSLEQIHPQTRGALAPTDLSGTPQNPS